MFIQRRDLISSDFYTLGQNFIEYIIFLGRGSVIFNGFSLSFFKWFPLLYVQKKLTSALLDSIPCDLTANTVVWVPLLNSARFIYYVLMNPFCRA